MSAPQLSVLLPTHRAGLAAISRIAQVCSWAGSDIEVIVRDNSGNAEKRALISQFRSENCQIVTVDPCEPLENFSELLRRAKGEFVFCPGDDDFCFDRAIEAMPALIKQFGGDPSVAGIAGQVVVETSNHSGLAHYANVDSDDVAARVTGYVNNNGPNVLLLSAMRRELYQRIMSFMNGMPHFLSFHDQIQSLLFLLSGKFIQLPRLLYTYDMGPWEKRETAQQRDVAFYTAAGLDPAVNKLQWILCGFEGASLILNSDILATLTRAQRQPIADLWFSVMFNRFKHNTRSTFGSALTKDAEQWCQKLLTWNGQLTFEKILAEISGFIALSSKTGAQDYFDFWDAIINKRQPPARRPAAPRPAAVDEPRADQPPRAAMAS